MKQEQFSSQHIRGSEAGYRASVEDNEDAGFCSDRHQGRSEQLRLSSVVQNILDRMQRNTQVRRKGHAEVESNEKGLE